MNLRVTNSTQTFEAIANIQARSADQAKYQDQISSGLRVKKASDDPGAYPELARARSASARLDTYTQNNSGATATLNAGVSALQDVNDVLVRAQQIAVEGANANTATDPTSREALATEVDGLIARTITNLNGRPDGQTLFAGTATNTSPFRVASTDASGRPATVVYDGATERARTITARNTTTDTRYVGSAVFQQPGADVFATLIGLRDDLRTNAAAGGSISDALNQRLTQLDAARTAVSSTTAEQASNLAILQSQQEVLSSAKLDSDVRVGDLSGTDYATAVVKLKEQDTALQAIYAVTAKLADPGLLDFIR